MLKKCSQVGHLIGLLPTIISWHMWACRDTAHTKGRFDSVEKV